MRVSKNELLFIYNSSFYSNKQALAYANTLDGVKLRTKDLYKEPITPMQVKEISEKMAVEVKDLLDINDVMLRRLLHNNDYSDDDLVRLMSKNPATMKTPIGLYADGGVFVTDAYSLIQLSIES